MQKLRELGRQTGVTLYMSLLAALNVLADGKRMQGALYAMFFQRHKLLYGTTDEQLGAIAVAFRKHACMNPNAVMQKPLTIEVFDEKNNRVVRIEGKDPKVAGSEPVTSPDQRKPGGRKASRMPCSAR